MAFECRRIGEVRLQGRGGDGMTERAEIVSLIENTIRETNSDVTVDESTSLIGEGGILDSQGLLQLLLVLEEHAETQLHTTFDWTSDAAFSSKNSPLRTVGTLVDFFVARIGPK
jgi:acyl carrier protein